MKNRLAANRRPRRSPPLWAAVLASLAIGCQQTPMDTTSDLAGRDLLAGADMKVGGGDLPGPTPDLSPPRLSDVPTDCPTGTTAATVYSTEVMGKCSLKECHGANEVHFSITSANEMKTKWVNIAAHQPDEMNYVTPGDLDKSYLIYKLMGQQSKLIADPQRAGGTMPLGGTALDKASLCKFISWIKAGAT